MIWSMIPHCLMWGIWRERNARTFEENERSIHDLKISSFKLCLSGHMLLSVSTFNILHDLLDFFTFTAS